MNLRRQLLLVSLLTLILPWAGCQFIRETETGLRGAQQEMLAGTAKAIADSLSQFHYELLSDVDDAGATNGRLYAHPLQRTPLIDGYVNDWTISSGAMVSLRGADGAIEYVLGSSGQYWFLFVDVRDASMIYATESPLENRQVFADRIRLLSIDPLGERTLFNFQAEAPGKIIATGHIANNTFNETRILAHWQDTASGYQLEIRIPKSLVDARLGLTVINTSDEANSGIASASFEGTSPGSVVSISPVLQSVAENHVQDGMRLVVIDKDGWRLAHAGNVSTTGTSVTGGPSGWIQMVYNLLLEPGADAALADPAPGGREQLGYISEALQGQEGTGRWFRNQTSGQSVVSVAQPIWSGTVQTGAIVLQQGTGAILSLTNQVLTRLVVLTLISTLIVIIVLLGYGSRLSSRIRRLSNAAESALDQRTLHSALPSALDGDEVGDLSRSFSSVLHQLGTYNDYLQSLASKLSHELRTPLTIVKSSLENLEHENLSSEALEYTARAKEGADRLQAILRAMSEANRTEELIENFEPEMFQIEQILASTIAAYADAWTDRRFDFQCDSIDTRITGSPDLIIQMLDKLVDNAVDFTQVDETISVSISREASDLLISVSNPGPPLPKEMQSRLFNSMVSLRSGDPGKHLGLGLYISRLIAEGHQGSISATNTANGVTVQVRLPGNNSS